LSVDFKFFLSYSTAEELQQAEVRIGLDRELERATPVFADVPRLICLSGKNTSFPDKQIDLNSCSLDRRLGVFCPMWRTTA
jgi:hypothetical protein